MQSKPGIVAEAALQLRDQVAIQLDNVQPATGFQQGLRQRALTRPDLYQVLLRQRVYGVDDPVDHRDVSEEILAKAFAGAV